MIQNMPHPSPSQCPRPPIFMPATFYDGSRELQGRQLSRGSRGSSSTKNVGTRHQSAFPNVSLFFFSSLTSFPLFSYSSFLLYPISSFSQFFLSTSKFSKCLLHSSWIIRIFTMSYSRRFSPSTIIHKIYTIFNILCH